MNDTTQKLRPLVKPLPLRLVVVLWLLVCLTFHSDNVSAFQIQNHYSNNNNINNYHHHNHHNQNSQPSHNKLNHLQRHQILTSTTNTRTTSQPEPILSLTLLSSTTIDSSSSSSDSGSSNTSDEITDSSSKVEVHESATTGFNNSSDGNSLWWKGTQYIQQIRQSVASMYTKSNDESDDETTLTFRQRLAKMGLAAMLSYGFVSNMSYAITVSCAWYIHNVQNKASPLGPGQWKPFLIIYSGFWIFNNIVRPIRLGISLAVVAPQFDRILNYIQTQYHVSRTVAIAVTVFMANVVGTISAMSIGIVIASLLSGVPILP